MNGTNARGPERQRERKRVKDVFDIDVPDSVMIDVYLDRTEFVPAIDPTYVFDAKQVKRVLQWLSGRFKKNLLLTGPTGCGKSSLVEQVAARLGYEVFRVPCHGRMEFPELLGSTQLIRGDAAASEDDGLLAKAANAFKAIFSGAEDGEGLLQYVRRTFSGSVTRYVYGPAVLAATRHDGGILLLDEANYLHPATIGALNTVLDGGPLSVAENGEVVQPKPGFRICFTGNSMDGGDDIALHRGVQRMSVALLNRFLVMRCDYMDQLAEAKVIGRTVSLPGHVVQALLGCANDTRLAFKASAIETTISTRTLVTWAKLVAADPKGLVRDRGELLEETLDFALLNAANTVDADAIRMNLRKSLDSHPDDGVDGVPAAPPGPSSMVQLLLSPNNGSPKIWGMHQLPGAATETIFWGGLDQKIVHQEKPAGYFEQTKPSKLGPRVGKVPYREVCSVSVSDPRMFFDRLVTAYADVCAPHISSVAVKGTLASVLRSVLNLSGKSSLLRKLT
jgi:cobaltochelatase CobS